MEAPKRGSLPRSRYATTWTLYPDESLPEPGSYAQVVSSGTLSFLHFLFFTTA